MNSQNETGAVGKRMLRVMAPAALLLWAFVAMGTTGTASSGLDGHYSSSGHVLLSDGTTLKVSQSLVFNKGRFYSMTRNAPAIVEASGRLETDLLIPSRSQIPPRSLVVNDGCGAPKFVGQ